MRAKILVVDDDGDARELARHVLGKAGHQVAGAASADRALEVLRTPGAADVVLIDIMMPGLDGEQLCRVLREQEGTRHLPLLALTSVKREAALLNAGFDDYVMKPVHPDALVARVDALLRRTGPSHRPAGVLRAGGVALDPDAHAASSGGRALALTPTEFRLLALLMANADRVLSHERLGEELWGAPDALYKHAVETHVTNLRRKLGTAGGRIAAVKGVGYRFDR